MSEPTPTYGTGLGTSNADAITLLGHDLAQELIGQISFGELAFWLVAKRRPDPGQLVMFEAVLVSLADHGFTPTAIAARLTYASAPDSLQGALAAGLLGGGSRFLGVTEDCAALPGRGAGRAADPADRRCGLGRRGPRPRDPHQAAGRFVPGLGHPVHKVEDPRTPVLFALARATGRSVTTWPSSPPSVACIQPCSAGSCRSTAQARVERSWPTWTSPSPSCGASHCSRAAPACSGTSPRSRRTRSASTSTWPSTATSTISHPTRSPWSSVRKVVQ